MMEVKQEREQEEVAALVITSLLALQEQLVVRRREVQACREEDVLEQMVVEVGKVVEKVLQQGPGTLHRLRSLGTGLLALRMEVERRVVGVMMEEDEGEEELCQGFRSLGRRLGNMTSCSEDRRNEVDFEEEGEVRCFSPEVLRDMVEVMFARLEQETSLSLAGLETSGPGLEQLEVLLQGLELVRRERLGLEGAMSRVEGLLLLCEGGLPAEEEEEEEDCLAEEYRQACRHGEVVDSLLVAGKRRRGEEVGREVRVGLLELSHGLEQRLAALYSRGLCCQAEAKHIKMLLL